MSNRFPAYGSSESVTKSEYQHRSSLSKGEIEIRLAIADCVIRHANGAVDGRKIFDVSIPRFEGRYAHHKIATHCLTAPEYIDQEDADFYESPPDQCRPCIRLRDNCDTVCDSDVDGVVEIDRRLFSLD